MKKSIFAFTLALTLGLSCKPEVYLGPLDNPMGNWKSSESIYYFNGETVYQNNTCEYSAISFYRDSLCCIEGRKGIFNYYMSEPGGTLTVDSLVWQIEELTGRFLKLSYLEDLRADASENGSSEESPDTDSSQTEEETDVQGPVQLPVEYNGVTIESDGNGGYTYTGAAGKKFPCRYVSHTEEDGTVVIDCWFDFRLDTYRPF